MWVYASYGLCSTDTEIKFERFPLRQTKFNLYPWSSLRRKTFPWETQLYLHLFKWVLTTLERKWQKTITSLMGYRKCSRPMLTNIGHCNCMGKKVKCTLVQGMRLCTGRKAHRGSRGIALPFLDHGTRRGWGVSVTPPGRSLPPGKTRYLLYRRLGGPQGRFGRTENLAPPGFDPRTVQPVVSRYTDWTIRPTRDKYIRKLM